MRSYATALTYEIPSAHKELCQVSNCTKIIHCFFCSSLKVTNLTLAEWFLRRVLDLMTKGAWRLACWTPWQPLRSGWPGQALTLAQPSTNIITQPSTVASTSTSALQAQVIALAQVQVIVLAQVSRSTSQQYSEVGSDDKPQWAMTKWLWPPDWSQLARKVILIFLVPAHNLQLLMEWVSFGIDPNGIEDKAWGQQW